MAGHPIWYELMTPDPDAVSAFYSTVGGWEVSSPGLTTDGNGHDYRMIARPDGGMLGGVLTLNQDMLDHGAKAGWIPYFDVDDVDASAATVERLGGKTYMPPRSIPQGRMAMLADPQGAPFYLMNPTPPPDMPDAKSDVWDREKAGHARWNELATTDAPAAKVFYGELFPWDLEDTMPMGERGDYIFIKEDGVQLGALNPWIGEGQPPTWLIYLGVESVMAAQSAIEANGGTVINGPHEVPGGEWIVVATDPAGAMIGFVGSKGE